MTASSWIRSLFGTKATAEERATRPSPRGRTSACRARPRLEALEDRYAPATFQVLNANDHGTGSLRAAINAANLTSEQDTIKFSISGADRTIDLTSALPALSTPIIIDGTSQSGYAGTPLIELNGASAGPYSSGLVLTASNCTIKGLLIDRFAQDGILLKGNASNNTVGGPAAGDGNVISGNLNHGIEIVGAGTSNNLIQGNRIGTNRAGTAAWANRYDGVLIRGGSSGNTVADNVISGNGNDGVEIVNAGTVYNVVQGNFIGTNPSGTAALPNRFDGILIRNGASNNTIGGPAAGDGNVISGNLNHGIEIVGAGAANNLVQGNLVGTNGTGSLALANRYDGVLIRGGASSNTIADNVISGNGNDGVEIVNAGTANNRVQGNFIGTDQTGTRALANRYDGVLIRTGATNNTIGGPAAGDGNVISGNLNHGVEIVNAGTTNNLVQGNFIGTDLSGTSALGNRYDGVIIRTGAFSNVIGGTKAGAGNVISGNGNDGVEIVNLGTTKNLVQGNTIGAQVDGVSPLGNGANGVRVTVQASNNTIGGTVTGAGNIIAFNNGNGVRIESGTSGTAAGQGNAVLGNSIFENLGLGINSTYRPVPVLTGFDPATGALKGYISNPTKPYRYFRIEFFAGDGREFLGAVTVRTNASGYSSFTFTLPSGVTSGEVITATATDQSLGNTSAFSLGIVVP